MLDQSQKQEYLGYLNIPEGYANYNNFKSFLYGKDDSLVTSLLKGNIMPFVKQLGRATIDVCDIGGGDGTRISKITENLFDELNVSTNLTFLDASEVGCQIFQEKKSSVRGLKKIEILHTLFEEFETDKKFDLVLLIHSIFAISDPDIVTKILNLKSEYGKVIIVGNKQDSFLAQLNQEASWDYSEKRFEIPDLEELLTREQIPHKRFEIETKFSVNKNNFDGFANELLHWVSLGHFDGYAPERKQVLMQKIQDLAESETEKEFNFKEIEVAIEI